MAGTNKLPDDRERKYVGSPEWFRCFPFGITRDTRDAPPIDNSHAGNPLINAGRPPTI